MPASEDRGAAFSRIVDALAHFVLASLLILPLFSVAYFDNWGSIDSTFMAHARFLVEHWPHPSWQPLWYGGTRFDYIYPPALPYGTAILAMALGIPIAQAYHVYTAILYVAGIAAVGLFVRYLSGSRASGWIASAASALVSPSVLLIPDIYGDAARRFLAPQRLNVLVAWGEGPHVSALALIPLALSASYWALTRRSPPGVAAASILCALVVSNNFYGSVTLAISYSLLVWSLWITRPSRRLLTWAVAVPVFSAGLVAFWLVPSYVRITIQNLRVVGAPGRPEHLILAVVIAGLFCFASYRYAFQRVDRCYPVFAGGLALAFSIVVLGHYWFGLEVFGAPVRFSPELDLASTLAALEAVRRLAHRLLPAVTHSRWGVPAGVALSFLVLVGLSSFYLSHCWEIYKEDHHPERRVEYRLSRWIADNLPGSRVFLDGSMRFWANVWYDIPQLSGGSDQGMLNPRVNRPVWEVRLAEDAGPSVQWLQAFGVDAVVVHGPNSAEIYHNFAHPRKFDGLLPVLFDNGEGDVIYRVPRRYPGLARVISLPALAGISDPAAPEALAHLAAYVEVVEAGPAIPAMQEWRGPAEIRVAADFEEDQALLLQVSYDPGWRAESAGRPLPVREDPLGQMVVLVPPGPREVVLFFRLPLENLVGRLLTALSALMLAVWIWADRRGRRRREQRKEG